MAVRGIANPLDGARVHLTVAFNAQHASNKVVDSLLIRRPPILLVEASVHDTPEAAEYIFASNEEADELQARLVTAQVLTWTSFLERMVPGHAPRR